MLNGLIYCQLVLIKGTAMMVDCNTVQTLTAACGKLQQIGVLKDAPLGIGLILLASVIWWFLKLIWKTITWLVKRNRLNKIQKYSLALSFTSQDFHDASKDYIVPYCSNVDPSNAEDLRHSVSIKVPIYGALDTEIQSTDGKRHIMLLADSGMGKTTFLLNYLLREEGRKNKKTMAVVSLNRKDSIDQIKNIENQRDTILLLDALDEDTEAIESFETRMDEIVNTAANYKAVVMTCRTQFFSQDSAIPKQTGLLKVGSNRAGASTMHEWKTLYLVPFDEAQIQSYIKKAIPFYRFTDRSKAKKIVSQISELAVRPMLLTQIPELVAAKAEAHNLWELYEFMVQQWALREQSWIPPETLKTLSKKIAVNLVLNRGTRGSERISQQELLELISISKESIDGWKLTSRSLLNRDSAGNIKFAHRSIMEYCFITAFIDGDDQCASIKWTDMMCQLFLSWGLSENNQTERLRELLNLDLTVTSLFPFVGSTLPASTISTSWAKQIIETGNHLNRTSIPNAWRNYTSKVIEYDDYVRVYDFAAGTIYQIVKTSSLDTVDMELYLEGRNTKNRLDSFGNDSYGFPLLIEFKALVDILAQKDMLNIIDDRSLYWLADTDSNKKSCLARVVYGDDLVQLNLLHLTHLAAVNSSVNNQTYFIDVYYGQLNMTMNLSVKALVINTFKGEADKIWRRDNQTMFQPDWSQTSK